MYRLSVILRAGEPVVKATKHGSVGIITINRPEKMNALNPDVRHGIINHMKTFDADPSVSVMILTGEGKAFIAGADVQVLQGLSFSEFIKTVDTPDLKDIPSISKPIIAAVNGYALGGGCEVAMSCDIIIASDKAKFGQPEVKIGTIPGLGGTQRLTRAIGKAKTMEWVLTGFQYTAEEAERAGLVSRVVKHEELMPTALKIAEAIAKNSQVTVKLAKRAVNASQETTLSMGLKYERDVFAMTFATEDRKEGMTAFVEKRAPNFKNE